MIRSDKRLSLETSVSESFLTVARPPNSVTTSVFLLFLKSGVHIKVHSMYNMVEAPVSEETMSC